MSFHVIFEQVRLHRQGSRDRCHSPHSCVMKVTGPDVYIHALYQTSKAHNCSNQIQRVEPGQCANATDAHFRRTYMCRDDGAEPGLPLLLCRSLRHFDCRTNNRKCPGDHWQRGKGARLRAATHYFDLNAVLYEGMTASRRAAFLQKRTATV